MPMAHLSSLAAARPASGEGSHCDQKKGPGGELRGNFCLPPLSNKEKRRTKPMKNILIIRTFAILVFLFTGSSGAFAQPETGGAKTLSPYFFVKSNDPDLDRLPLKSPSVSVRISC